MGWMGYPRTLKIYVQSFLTRFGFNIYMAISIAISIVKYSFMGLYYNMFRFRALTLKVLINNSYYK